MGQPLFFAMNSEPRRNEGLNLETLEILCIPGRIYVALSTFAWQPHFSIYWTLGKGFKPNSSFPKCSQDNVHIPRSFVHIVIFFLEIENTNCGLGFIRTSFRFCFIAFSILFSLACLGNKLLFSPAMIFLEYRLATLKNILKKSKKDIKTNLELGYIKEIVRDDEKFHPRMFQQHPRCFNKYPPVNYSASRYTVLKTHSQDVFYLESRYSSWLQISVLIPH